MIVVKIKNSKEASGRVSLKPLDIKKDLLPNEKLWITLMWR